MKRNPLDKQNFLQGNRQRWCLIFTVIGLIIMVATSYGWITNPEPFLQFFLSIGVSFILGASASAVMNSWRASSSTESIETQSDKTINRIERPKDYDNGA